MHNNYRSSNLGRVDSIAASPGFTWGRSGNVGSGAYLLNDTVPSNLAGRIVSLYNAQITSIGVAVENADTFVVSIERNNGDTTYTEIATLTVTSLRKLEVAIAIDISYNDELCCKIKSGSCKNPVVYLIIKGDSV